MCNTHEKRTRATRSWLTARGAELRQRLGWPADSGRAATEELDFIVNGLQRMDSGTFEICESCGNGIEQERLEFTPYATRCRQCTRRE
jgi:RNA polymerase-binding transcription factor DksA